MLGRVLQLAGRRAVLQRGVLVRAAASSWQQQPLWGAQSPRQQDAQQPAAAAVVAVLRQQRGRCLSSSTRRQQRPAAKPKAAQETEDDEEEDRGGAVAVGDLSAADDEYLEDWEELEEQVGPELSTGGVEWGEKALAVVQQLLGGAAAAGAGAEGLQDIRLFSFRAIPSSKRLDIRLDKLTDQYGSPSLDDVAAFSRQFNAAFEAAIGEAAAGEIEIEVSSPGAERQVRVPAELERFAELPMRVEYSLEGDKVDVKVLTYESHDAAAALTRWRLADVRANRTGGKGRGLSRKQRDAVYELPLAAIKRVNLHIDF
ncbi:hypothetical protein ABPG75_000144 [Micractinium tetrahymenae]